MPQVFSSNRIHGDVWDMQGAIINFGYSGTSGGTVQSGVTTSFQNAPIIATGLTLSFSRGLTKRFPINVRRVIYLMGNPDGQLQMQCLFGPGNAIQNFLTNFSHLGSNQATSSYLSGGSNPNSNCSITITPFGQITYAGQGGTTGNVGLGVWEITDPVLTSIGLTISESGGAGATAAIATVSMSFNNLAIN